MLDKSVDMAFSVGLKIVDKIQKTQKESIQKAGELVANAHMDGKTFYVSGSGHSHSVAEELYGRAGGLAFTVPIMTVELTLSEHPTKSTYIERLSGYAKILTELYKVSKGDVVLIASNSGRNAYPIELALEAKALGAKVIAITNLNHSKQVTSRHESGKRLFEIADIVIDNCGEIGDAATYLEGVEVPILPTSSISNAFICTGLSAVVCNVLNENKQPVEVFYSANVDGGFEKNEAYMEKYCRLYTRK